VHTQPATNVRLLAMSSTAPAYQHSLQQDSGERAELTRLVALSGLQLQPEVLAALLDVIELGAQPRHIADYIRTVIQRAVQQKPAARGGA
jgi:hypothetical protein